MLLELYVTTSHEPLVYKRFNSNSNSVDDFLAELKLQPSLPPIFHKQAIAYLHIKRSGLYYVATTAEKLSSTDALVITDLLSKFYQAVKDMCGCVSEQAVTSNSTLIYEIIDEAFAFGYPQVLTAAKLKPYIQSEPVPIIAAVPPQPTVSGLFGLERQARPAVSSAPGKSLNPRLEQDGRQNEVFVDVIERLSAQLHSDGSVEKCEVLGTINMRCVVSNVSRIKMALNSDLRLADDTPVKGYGAVYVDKCSFDACVDVSQWSQRVLYVTPPDGEVSLMSYRLTGDVTSRLPVKLVARHSHSTNAVTVELHLMCDTPSNSEVINAEVRFSVPQSVTSMSQRLTDKGQSAELLKDKVVLWRVPRLRGQAATSAILTLMYGHGMADQSQSTSLSTLTVNFEVSSFVSSGVHIRFLSPVQGQSQSAVSSPGSSQAQLQQSDCVEHVGRVCSKPQANFSLHRHRDGSLLMQGQAYTIIVELLLPESPVNRELGMFSVGLDLYSYHGETVSSSLRSALLTYKSALLQTIETLVFLPNLLFVEGQTQSQKLLVPLYEEYYEHPYKPTRGVIVSVNSRHIQIYSSHLYIYAKFTGLRYVMFHWPMMSMLVGISCNMFFLSLVAFVSWYRFVVEPQLQAMKVSKQQANKLLHDQRRRQARATLEQQQQARSRGGQPLAPAVSAPGSLHLLPRTAQGSAHGPAHAAAAGGPGSAQRRQPAVVTLSHAAAQPDTDSDSGDDGTEVFFDPLPVTDVAQPASAAAGTAAAGGTLRHRRALEQPAAVTSSLS